MSDVLLGVVTADDAIRRDVWPGLDLLTTGSIPHDVSDLLVSEKMSSLIAMLRARYDMVIIDTPPMLVASDVSAMANIAGMVFLVARFQRTSIGEINESARQLRRARAPLKGVLFNGVSPSAFGYRSRYGAYRYVAYQYQSRKATK